MSDYGLSIFLYICGVGMTYHLWRVIHNYQRWHPSLYSILLMLIWPYGGIKALVCYPYQFLIERLRQPVTPVYEIPITQEASDKFIEAILQDIEKDIEERNKDKNAKLH